MKESKVLQSIAAEMRAGVLVLDRAGLILHVNPSFARCFSIDQDVRGRSVDKVIGQSDLMRALDGFTPVKSPGNNGDGNGGGVYSSASSPVENMEIRENDRFFMVRTASFKDENSSDVTAENGSGGDRDEGLIVFLHDITEAKRLEAIKKDFVANVSHELRTPLASIKGYSETLLDGGMEDRETLRDFLRVIDKQATRMSHLIEDLLVLSRLESHPMPMEPEAMDLGELITSVADGLKKQAEDKDVVLMIDLGDERGECVPKVTGDRVRLEQVLVNLLDNAIKYTPSGGRVEVNIAADNGEVRVDIIDTGIGIPASDMPRIFERFYRVDKARSREQGGTGLGLAIVKHIVQGLDGRVWVESELDCGSRFSFTLKPAEVRNP